MTISRTRGRRYASSLDCDWLRRGNFGDRRPVGNDVSEMRVDFGPGYRLYFTKRQNIVVVMLAGGDKSTQARDVKRAQKILQQLELE